MPTALKWILYAALFSGYIYLVFYYPQSEKAEETLVVDNVVAEDTATLQDVDSMPEAVAEEQEEQEAIAPAPEIESYTFNTSFAVLTGSYDSEEKAKRRKAQLAGQYISSKVVYVDGSYCLILKELSSIGAARSAKADLVALGVQCRIRTN